MANDVIRDQVVGIIAYQLTVNGDVIEVIEVEDPVEYLHGANNLVPGLEEALTGRKVGETFEVVVEPKDGYGEYDEEQVIAILKEDLNDLEGILPGAEIELMDETGDILDAVVEDVTEDSVIVDFNPPLAGETLVYTVEVVGVRPATEKELEVGFPQSLIDELMAELEE